MIKMAVRRKRKGENKGKKARVPIKVDRQRHKDECKETEKIMVGV
jgi:hypothetical protein